MQPKGNKLLLTVRDDATCGISFEIEINFGIFALEEKRTNLDINNSIF